MFSVGRHDDLMVCALDFRSSYLGSSLDRDYCVVLVETLFTRTVPIKMGTGGLNAEGVGDNLEKTS